MNEKELEKKYKPMQANVTVDLKLLFREQKAEKTETDKAAK